MSGYKDFVEKHPYADAVIEGIIAGGVAGLISPLTPVGTAFVAAAIVAGRRLPGLFDCKIPARNQTKPPAKTPDVA